MKKYDVICPMCCGTFHETTALFNPDRMAHGAMFDAKQHVKDAAWSVFPPYESTDAADCVCPGCGADYCDGVGRVIRLQECGEIDGGWVGSFRGMSSSVTVVVDGAKIINTINTNAEMDRLMTEYDVEVPEPVFRNDNMLISELDSVTLAYLDDHPVEKPPGNVVEKLLSGEPVVIAGGETPALPITVEAPAKRKPGRPKR